MNENDMSAVETAARKSGMVMVGQVEVSLKEKLTSEFMQLGKSVHMRFDKIADAARDGARQADLIGLLVNRDKPLHYMSCGLRGKIGVFTALLQGDQLEY